MDIVKIVQMDVVVHARMKIVIIAEDEQMDFV